MTTLRHCWVCDAPIAAQPTVIVLGRNHEVSGHRFCADAWCDRDRAAVDQFRAQACADGHHRYPGQWEKDPADPYGDAALWHCAKGCGYTLWHPGYGIGRQIHELGLDRPSQPTLFEISAR